MTKTATFREAHGGNMTCRVEDNETFIQTYNTENRAASIIKLASGDCATPGNYASKWDFAYDGDGVRTSTLYTPYVDGQPQTAVLTAYFMGGAYEVAGSAVRKYYSIAGMMVAMRDANGLKFILTDHLGSVLAITDDSGSIVSEQRYLPFGQVREDVGTIAQTDFGYTGQRSLADMGLMDYRARLYDPILGRFTQPDTIIPRLENPQSLNRYSYVLNDPVKLNDPTGHFFVEDDKCTELSCSGDPNHGGGTGNGGGGGGGGGGGDGDDFDEIINTKTLRESTTPYWTQPVAHNLYLQGWQNFNDAWHVWRNSEVNLGYRALAGSYMTYWAGAHLLLAAGIGGLSCVATGPVCVTPVEAAIGLGQVANTACGGDFCVSESQQVVTVIGRYPYNQNLAETIGGNYLNIQNDVWKSMNVAEQWARNKEWLQEAVIRGDVFRLASDISRAEPGTGFFNELNYLLNQAGYTITWNGSYLIPPIH